MFWPLSGAAWAPCGHARSSKTIVEWDHGGETRAHRTLPLAVWDFQGRYSSNIPPMLPVVTLTSVPLILVYACGQERIIKGMAGSWLGIPAMSHEECLVGLMVKDATLFPAPLNCAGSMA